MIKRRIAIFNKITLPIVESYVNKGSSIIVDSSLDVGEIKKFLFNNIKVN